MTANVRNSNAATIVMWIAVFTAITAGLLWLRGIIRPPAGIIAGTAAIIVIVASARHRKSSS